MIKKFERKISTTQSNYKFNLERKYITQQCSYNLPNDIEAYLLSKNAIVRETPNGSNRYVQYGLTDGYKLVLGDSILAIIGEIYRNKANKVVFTHTEGADGSSPKMQLKKTDFASKGDDYKWFVDLYNKNIEGVNFIAFVDDVAKTLTFDVELSREMFSGVVEDEEVSEENTDYDKFKNLLGWFVKQLNINNNLEEGRHTSGQGYKEGAGIREYYKEWRDYGDFTLDCNIVSGYSSTSSKLNYINKTDSGINVRPYFDKDSKKVVAVYIDIYIEEDDWSEEANALREQKYDIIALDLFNESKPNDLLKELFDKYKSIIQNENSNLKDVFREWLSQRTTKRGETWSDGSIKNCIRMLEKGFAKFDGYKEYTSCFEMVELSQFLEYQKYLQTKEGVMEFDASENRWFSKGIAEYAAFLEDYKKPQMISIDSIKYKTECNDEITDSNGKVIKLARNRIFFGAPGTGKSYELNEQTKKFIGGNNTYYERVTFHPEYTHSGFFGTYKPVPNPRDVDKITYAFIPGPFLRVLSKALINANSDGEKKPYVLLIEEINRANVASVFGEVFQLLDREDDGANAEFLNASKYSISPSEDVKKYLVDEFKKAGLETKVEAFSNIRIPDNMFIWASMNSADQGVFPMDTAFKRRWEFEYFGINKSEEKIKEYFFKVNEEVINWNALRKAINYRLTSLKINEDKLMGPFFMSNKVLNTCTYDHSIVLKAIQNKVIMYLFEDAGRQKRKDIFVNGYEKTYSEICADFEEKGLGIFAKEIVDKYNEIKQ
jgi:hypothetical protein